MISHVFYPYSFLLMPIRKVISYCLDKNPYVETA